MSILFGNRVANHVHSGVYIFMDYPLLHCHSKLPVNTLMLCYRSKWRLPVDKTIIECM